MYCFVQCYLSRLIYAFLLSLVLLLINLFFVVFCLDAKFRFDDNAEYRQKALFELRDTTQEDSKEIQAAQFDLNYIALDGTCTLTNMIEIIS